LIFTSSIRKDRDGKRRSLATAAGLTVAGGIRSRPTYLGSFFEGLARDLDPEAGRFSFAIRDLNVPIGTLLTITVNYSADQLETHNAAMLTTLFSNPVPAKEGGPIEEPPGELEISVSGTIVTITFRGALQSAPSATGPWTDVPGATSPFATSADQNSRFFRARSLLIAK
jgi:hypothetical protein